RPAFRSRRDLGNRLRGQSFSFLRRGCIAGMENPEKRSFGCGTILAAAFVWLVIGGLWAAGQFVVSEAFNQLALHSTDDSTGEKFQDISDFLAYPAGNWYEIRQNTLDRAALKRVLAKEDLPDDKRKEGERLL